MQRSLFRRAVIAPLLVAAVGGALLVTASPVAAADQTACHDAALARQRTEVNADMTVPQFDPALGTLLEVSVPSQSVHLDTDAVFENTAASATVFAEQMIYDVAFTSPAGLASPPAVSGTVQRVPSQMLTAFDGTLDFLGTSAVTQPSTSLDATAAPVSSTDPAVLAAFTGSATMPFHVATQIGETFTGGGGNVQFQINTFAAAAVQVCYRYAPPAPTTTTTLAPVVVADAPPAVRPPPVAVTAPPAFTG